MENLAVTINLPNLRLNIPEKEINFHYLERIIFALSRKIGQEILEGLLELIDDRLMAERERGNLSNQGKRLRYMTTLLGDITFSKRLYRQRSGQWKYLLDERMGIKKNQRISELGEKAEGYLAFISGSYRNSEDLMQRFYGDSRSFESIFNLRLGKFMVTAKFSIR